MRKLILALGTTALLAAPAAASAADFTVTGGRLDWTMANQFDGSADNARTWLGYAIRPGTGQFPNGRIESIAPATLANPLGAIIPGLNAAATPTPVKGVNERYRLSYPAAATGSTLSTSAQGKLTATVELKGGFTFAIHEASGFKPGTLTDPVIAIDGATGTLRASGTKISPTGPAYDRTDVQFALDLSDATYARRPDGSIAVTNIVPVSTAASMLSGFPANSRLYGTMALTVAADEIIPATPLPLTAGPAGPAGPQGPAGPAGKDATFRVVRLAKAAFATKSEVHVRLLDRKTKKTVARGTVERRTLRLSVPAGTSLKGTYTLQRVAKKASGKRTVTISIR